MNLIYIMIPQSQTQTNNINQNEKLSNLISLELTEYFFDLITDENVHIDKFILEFKDNLNYLLKSILNEYTDGMFAANISNYYLMVVNFINDSNDKSKHTQQLIKVPNEIKNKYITEQGYTTVERILDLFFYQKQNNNKIIKVTKNNLEVFVLPLAVLDSFESNMH